MAAGEILSVVVPSRGEGARLIDAVREVRRAIRDAEVVVCAYDESEAVRRAVLAEGAEWVEAPRACRGLQLRLGAARASGGLLLFHHVDSRLPAEAGRAMREAMATAGVAGGAFRLRFDARHPVLDALSAASATRFTSGFLGDQSMFCTRSAYEAAGGFRDQPLFEDVDLARRLARIGRLVRLPSPVTTSARRFLARGPLRQLVHNALLLLAFHLGTPPERLAAAYERSGPMLEARRAGSARAHRPRREGTRAAGRRGAVRRPS